MFFEHYLVIIIIKVTPLRHNIFKIALHKASQPIEKIEIIFLQTLRI